MERFDLIHRGSRSNTALLALSLLATLAAASHWCAGGPATGPASQPVNLAAGKPARASSIENDEHNAAAANDGKLDTSWIADDEPERGAEWWQVDLEKPCTLSACEICWPYDGKAYQCRIEGSVDQTAWVLLSDQTRNTGKAQVQEIRFDKPAAVRFVRITVTGFEAGCWAGLSEVKLFGTR